MKKMLPIGVENFKVAIDQCYYVDKTMLIKSLISSPDGSVFLFTRPRRFGKSLALSMLDYFFSLKHKNESSLFNDLLIGKEAKIMLEQGSFPLIHINLKTLNSLSYGQLIEDLSIMIKEQFENFSYLLESKELTKVEIDEYKEYLKGTKDESKLRLSLYKLTKYLFNHHKKKVMVLIDEYDSPIYRARNNNYFIEATSFFRTFFGSVLKGNDYLKEGVITGVMQIAKESLFSDLNNLTVDNVINGNYSEFFGFDEKETKNILSYYNCLEKFDLAKKWYDGYKIGDKMIFNPWSILKFIQFKCKPDAYWVETGEQSLLSEILFNNKKENNAFLNNLIKNKEVCENIDPSITFSELTSASSLASYLLLSGYLTIKGQSEDGRYFLGLPNNEVAKTFQKEILNKYVSFDQKDWTKELKKAFKNGDEKQLKNILETYVISSLSYYNFSLEKNYQCLILGMSAITFFDYHVKSEVNVGNGRCDIILLPNNKDDASYILELKRVNRPITPANLKKYAASALNQIKKNNYINEIKKDYSKCIIIYGMAFYKQKAEITSETIINKEDVSE